MLDLGFDHFAEGGLVLVLELLRCKRCGFALDEFGSEGELVLVDGDLFDFAEKFGWLAQLFVVTHDIGHHAGKVVVGGRGDGDKVLAASEGDLAEGYLLCGLESFAHYGKGLGLHVVFGDDEVWLLEEFGIDLVYVDELGDGDGVAGGDAEIFDLLGLDGDVLALAVLVSLNDVALFDGTFFAGDLLVLDALAGLATELVEADLALGFSCGEELDAE